MNLIFMGLPLVTWLAIPIAIFLQGRQLSKKFPQASRRIQIASLVFWVAMWIIAIVVIWFIAFSGGENKTLSGASFLLFIVALIVAICSGSVNGYYYWKDYFRKLHQPR